MFKHCIKLSFCLWLFLSERSDLCGSCNLIGSPNDWAPSAVETWRWGLCGYILARLTAVSKPCGTVSEATSFSFMTVGLVRCTQLKIPDTRLVPSSFLALWFFYIKNRLHLPQAPLSLSWPVHFGAQSGSLFQCKKMQCSRLTFQLNGRKMAIETEGYSLKIGKKSPQCFCMVYRNWEYDVEKR